MRKKIILINPPTDNCTGINNSTIYPPLGLAYLASYIRDKAVVNTYDINIIDANIMNLSVYNLVEKIIKINPDILGFQINVVSSGRGLQIVNLVKDRCPHILVCLGGPLLSSDTKDILKNSKADIGFFGESEISFMEFCEGKKLNEIKGIIYRKNNKFIFNERRPLIEYIDEIPHPAFDLLPDFKLYCSRARRKPVGVIITSRGCPFRCTFCSSNVFGNKFRAHSPEYVLEEIDLLVEKYGIKQLDILDDNFTLDMIRAEKILDLLIKRAYNLSINFQNGIRADFLNENIIRKMKLAGVFKVGIGIESGNKNILKSIKKSLDLNKVIKAINLFRKYDIITAGFFIIGFPNDTEETIKETISFAIKSNPTIVVFSLFMPFYGTEIYFFLKKNNLLLNSENFYFDSGYFGSKVYNKHLFLTRFQVTKLQKMAFHKFYFRISKVVELIMSIGSFNELKWTIKSGFQIFKNILIK